MFKDIRTRGGNGIDSGKPDPSQPVGVNWQKLSNLRSSYKEKIRSDIEAALDKVCSSYHLRVSHSNVGGHQSIIVLPEGSPATSPTKSKAIVTQGSISPVKAVTTQESVTPSVVETVTDGCNSSSPQLPVKDVSVVCQRLSSNSGRTSPSFDKLSTGNKSPNKPSKIPLKKKKGKTSPERTPTNDPVVVPPHENNSPFPSLATNEQELFSPASPASHINCTYIKLPQVSLSNHKHPRPPSADLCSDVPCKKSVNKEEEELEHLQGEDEYGTSKDAAKNSDDSAENSDGSPTEGELQVGRTVSRVKPVVDSFLPVKNSPFKAVETRELRTQLLKAKINQKIEREESIKRELEAKKERERQERIRRREERAKKVAENKAALLKKADEKKKKIESSKEESTVAKVASKGTDDKGQKLKLRHLAAEKRRKEKEKEMEQKQRAIEMERQLQEELQRKRMEMREEMRIKKQQERAEYWKTIAVDSKPDSPLTTYKDPVSTSSVASSSASAISSAAAASVVTIAASSASVCTTALTSVSAVVPTSVSFYVSANSLPTNVSVSMPTSVSTSAPAVVSTSNVPTNVISHPFPVSGSSAISTGTSAISTGTLAISSAGTSAVSTSTSAVSAGTLAVSAGTSAVSTGTSAVSTGTSAVSASVPKAGGPSKYQNIPSYQITPVNKDPLMAADNYDINDLTSGDSSDDEDCPKKTVPAWAAPLNLNRLLAEQEYTVSHGRGLDVEKIFPPEELLQMPDLQKIFRRSKRRFLKRTSSAQWTSPMLKKTRQITDES